MTDIPAYILVSHGSRDPRPQIGMSNLANQICEKISRENFSDYSMFNQKNTILVETACLELTSSPLHQKIIEFANLALISDYKKIKILPLFLSPGVHVQEDIPLQVNLAQKELGDQIKLCVQPYLGEHFQLKKLLQEEFNSLNCQGKIIFAHGSKRQGANQPVEKIAENLSAKIAYWSVFPDLETQIKQLISEGITSISIVPYFLFTGSIIELLKAQILSLQKKYPHLELKLGNTLDKNPNLIQLIMETLQG